MTSKSTQGEPSDHSANLFTQGPLAPPATPTKERDEDPITWRFANTLKKTVQTNF